MEEIPCLAKKYRFDQFQRLISFVVTEDNVDQIAQAVQIASDAGVRGVRFGAVARLGRADVSDVEYFRILAVAEERIRNMIAHEPPNVDLEVHFNPLLSTSKSNDSWNNAALRTRGEGQTVIFINHEGDIYPFPLLELPEFRIGNMLEDSFSQLWSSSEVLKQLRQEDQIAPQCKTCDTPCSLSSRSMAYLWTGSITGKVPCHRWDYLA